MIKAYRSVVVWRLVGPSSGAKTCPHVFSRHSSLSKHSHRVSDWLTNSSHHAKLIVMDHWSFYTLSGLSSSCVWHTATRPQRRYGKFFTVKPTVLPLLHCVLQHLPKLNNYSFDINVDKNQETVQFTLENTKHQHYYIAPIPSSPSQSIGHDHLLSITIPFSFP